MAVWTVWEHDKFADEAAERAVFVRDGFSWTALVLGPLWLLFFRHILLAIAYVAIVGAVLTLASRGFGDPVASVVSAGLAIWFAFEARGLRRWALARRGWDLAGIVEARTFREAERRHFADRLRLSPLDDDPETVWV